jgi:hypothetical protein
MKFQDDFLNGLGRRYHILANKVLKFDRKLDVFLDPPVCPSNAPFLGL